MNSGTREENPINLVDAAAVVWRRKWIIIGLTAAAAVSLLAFLLITQAVAPDMSPFPDYYEPQAMVLVSGDSQSPSFGQGQNTSLGDLAAVAGLSNVGGASYGLFAVELVRSRSVLDEVIERHSVVQRLDVEEPVRTNARQAVRENLQVEYNPETALLKLRFRSIDAGFATAVVNDLVELLNERFATLGGNRATNRRSLLEEKTADVERRISELESQIADFTRRHGVMNIQAVTEEQTQTIANLRSDLILKEMEIQTYSDFARIDDPVLQRLRVERDNLRNLLSEMEDGASGMDSGVLSQQELPELSFEYERLRRNLDVQSRIYENLAAELELARLNQEGQEPILEVIELAEELEVESGPSRSLIAMGGTFVAFFLSLFFAFVIEYIQRVRADSNERAKFRA